MNQSPPRRLPPLRPAARLLGGVALCAAGCMGSGMAPRQHAGGELDRWLDPATMDPDVPHPSANATAALLLLKLSHLTGRYSYRSQAERLLRIFSLAVKEMSIHGGTYYCALDAWFTMLKLTVEAIPSSDLAVSARRLTGPYTVVVYGEDKGRIVPCLGETCYAPVTNNEELERFASRLFSLPSISLL